MKMKNIILLFTCIKLISCSNSTDKKNTKVDTSTESKAETKLDYQIKDIRVQRIIEEYSKALGHECVKCIIVDGSHDEARIILASTFNFNDLEKRYPQGILYLANDTLLIYSSIDRIFSFGNESNNNILNTFKLKLANNNNRKITHSYHGTLAINYSQDTLDINRFFSDPFGIPCMNCGDEYRFPINKSSR